MNSLASFCLSTIVIFVGSAHLTGQCHGTPTDSTFDSGSCDSADIDLLRQIIELNGLSEATSSHDDDDGDGTFEPTELGYQVWEHGRVVTLYLSVHPESMRSFDYQISYLPDTIGNIRSLTVLSLSRNNLSSVPQSIGNLTRLVLLGLHSNQLSAFPIGICNLDSLENLTLDYNNISEIPDCIGNLTNLKRMGLSHNQISKLPETIGQLINLASLNLSENEISILPESFWNLENLEELNVGNNLLSRMDQRIAILFHLKSLTWSYNELERLPQTLWKLEYLESLCLSGNHLSVIPDSIKNLIKINYLCLQSNLLTDLPDEIWNLVNLVGLFLSDNQLDTLSEGIGYLTNLITLQLDNNQLTTLPGSLCDLTNLWYLYVSGNHLWCENGVVNPSLIPFCLRQIPYVFGLYDQECGLSVSGTEADQPAIPVDLRLYEPFPNPFNAVTTIRFSVPTEGRINLRVYNVLGREISTLVDKILHAGLHTIPWSPDNEPSGLYFVTLTAGPSQETRKVLLLK